MLRKIELVVGFIVVFIAIAIMVIVGAEAAIRAFAEFGLAAAIGVVVIPPTCIWCTVRSVYIVFDWLEGN